MSGRIYTQKRVFPAEDVLFGIPTIQYIYRVQPPLRNKINHSKMGGNKHFTSVLETFVTMRYINLHLPLPLPLPFLPFAAKSAKS